MVDDQKGGPPTINVWKHSQHPKNRRCTLMPQRVLGRLAAIPTTQGVQCRLAILSLCLQVSVAMKLCPTRKDSFTSTTVAPSSETPSFLGVAKGSYVVLIMIVRFLSSMRDHGSMMFYDDYLIYQQPRGIPAVVAMWVLQPLSHATSGSAVPWSFQGLRHKAGNSGAICADTCVSKFIINQ